MNYLSILQKTGLSQSRRGPRNQKECQRVWMNLMMALLPRNPEGVGPLMMAPNLPAESKWTNLHSFLQCLVMVVVVSLFINLLNCLISRSYLQSIETVNKVDK